MSRPDQRKVISISCKPEFYDRVRSYCEERDIPFTVWVRELIKRELNAIQPLDNT
jgi:hypothetical protein